MDSQFANRSVLMVLQAIRDLQAEYKDMQLELSWDEWREQQGEGEDEEARRSLASWYLQRALLTPWVVPGSLYRFDKSA